MKSLALLWLASALTCCAFSGSSIVPVLVQVFDEEGSPVAGAKVTIDAGLNRVIERELDPNSEFKKLGKAAPQTARTNKLGHALVYGGGSWGPAGEGKVTFVRGQVEVSAPGFRKAVVKFDRKVESDPKGAAELTLKVVVTLEKEP